MSHESSYFVIQNQHYQYLDKQGNWRSGKDSQALYRTEFHDEALNTLIETNAKDIHQRCKVVEVAIDDKKRPVVTVYEEALKLEKPLANENSEEVCLTSGE